MSDIPVQLKLRFDQLLVKKAVPFKYHNYYRKWLRYYLDFCRKYRFPEEKEESLSHFLKKLQEKHLTI